MFAFGVVALLVANAHFSAACGAGGIGGGNADDSRIIQNPTFTMDFSPPVAWTYPENNAESLQSFFPGQSLTQSDANIKANSDIEAAVLSAIVDSGFPTQGVTVRSAYTAQEVSDCRKATGMMTAIGQRFGLVESGAVVKLITPAEIVQMANCVQKNFYMNAAAQPTVIDYNVQTTVQIEGISASKFQMRQIARAIMVNMNFRYNARFVSEIQIQ
ncbi:hypothetical protein QR680_007665 [Steinernema hermaphroditum]|uniref:Uncharacterized protein n=1 Tax=Steinernema hermaphroditum TaxID=289476 RepID=A0AA39IDW3_9BILA|nr:hypothetical protein QR680_007665 [Steinernema hermaphroditum]